MIYWRNSPVKRKYMGNQITHSKKFKFSGHDTFPLRYGWLYKIVQEGAKGDSFTNPEQDMIKYGAGKNMVTAMKYWGRSFGILSKNYKTVTQFGESIFGENGYDKYLEDDATLWILHWKLARAISTNTVWWWAFNIFPDLYFDKRIMFKSLKQYLNEYEEIKVVDNTLKKDIDCFINTYSVRPLEKNEITENTLQCPLAELGLIQERSNRGEYKFQTMNKKDIPPLIFYWALSEYWNNLAYKPETLTLEQITYNANSPGKIFKLDESSIISYLSEIERASNKKYKWSETLGSRTVQITQLNINPDFFLKKHYK